MTRFFLLLLLFLPVCIIENSTMAQSMQDTRRVEPKALTPQQLYTLSAVPPLTLPERYKGPDAPLLPYWVDNSTQPYFRSITSQSGFECGQSAGIAFTFTYEIDRLRNVPANTTTNTYPTHFTWDFLNNGDNYTGASCFDSWEIVRTCGNMNVADYGGGLNTGGYLRWITGYDKYYNGMANRLNYMRSIRCDSPEGLQALKYWLYDHLEGSGIGGIGIFYGKYFNPTNVLPAGTPEAGKYVQTSWGPSPSHTWTVCGYNDSIRWDYNNDGLYTNNIDINGDGKVDMHDWEVGGLKFASGYAGTGWSNQGFCYMTYKCVADAIGYGGIWNHSIYVIDVKETCAAKLTAKITLKHTSRNKLKVTMGISTDLAATAPSYVLEFPIFKYQGGDHYMQGGTAEADKTIEFGFDLAPLINQLTNGQQAKFFLQVQENDPSGTADGEIVSYALLDYTSGMPVTVSCPNTNVPIANNTMTRLSVNHAVTVTRPAITTTTLPPAYLYTQYNYQLNAANGTLPYLWDAKLDYPETTSTASFPNTNDHQLTLSNNNTGYATVDLPFEFPFYKRTVNKLYVYADGFIVFDDQPFTWPFLIDKMLLFKYTSIIAPFLADLNLYPSQSDGIWYGSDASSMTIRWKASIYNMSGSSNLNFAVKFYKEGKIEFYYGTMNYPASTTWIGGISGGDNKNYQFSLLNGSPAITANTLDKLTACGYPVEMQITEEGLFTGVPKQPYQNRPVTFQVNDNNNLTNKKTFLFSTMGLLVSFTVNSGGDSVIEFGETASLNMTVYNTSATPVHNINMVMSETDPYMSMVDNAEYVGDLAGGQTITINNAFSFNVSQVVPDDYEFSLTLTTTSSEHNFQKTLDLVAFAPGINPGDIILPDGDNGRLDPGETTDMLIDFANNGGARANNVSVTLSSGDPYLVINDATGIIGTLKPDSVKSALFNVTVDGDAPFEHLYKMNYTVTADNGYSSGDSLYLFSGDIVEDFETGNFNKFPWYLGGNGLFYVDGWVHYEGSYCTRSGWIYDNEESSLNMNVQVLQNGKISFYKMVSCENDPNGTNYDYLGFYIDNVEMGRWDGSINWSKETFDITKGYHTLKWLYHKDYSVSWGSDCVWIDFITFPPIAGAYPVLDASPLSFEKTYDMGQTGDDSFTVTNSGGGIMKYSALVYDTIANKGADEADNLSGSYIECYTEGFVPGQDFSWTFAVHNLSPDDEYIKHVKIDIPPGVTVSSATNFSGGSGGEMVFQGTTGNGASLNWHGTGINNRGVVKPGETAVTVINGTIGESFFNDVFAVYSIRGDSVGAGPHEPSGYVKLKNFSLPNTWLTLSNNIGTLMTGESSTVNVHFNAQGIPADDYSCSIVVKDLFNNKAVIPVVMHVLDTTAVISINDREKSFNARCYPNPFGDHITIEYGIQQERDIAVDVYDISGRRIRNLADKTAIAGIYRVTWDGRDESGDPVPPGVYYCRLNTGGRNETLKMILMR